MGIDEFNKENTNALTHDKVSRGSGENRLQNCKRINTSIQLPKIAKKIHPASDLCHPCSEAIPQDRLSWHGANATRPVRLAQSAGTQISATLFNTLLCGKKSAQKKLFASTLAAIFEDAGKRGLIDEKPQSTIDATGLETRHASRHYVKRSRKGKEFTAYSWPKLTAVAHIDTHLIAGVALSRGPSQDSPDFAPALKQAVQNLHIDSLLADAGYDGEHNHQLAREELGIRLTAIRLNPRRFRKRNPRANTVRR